MNLTVRTLSAVQLVWERAGSAKSPLRKWSLLARSGLICILVCALVITLGAESTATVGQHAESETAQIAQADSSKGALQECSGLTTCSPLMTPTEFAPYLAVGDRGRRTVPAKGQTISGRLPAIETPPPQA